MSKRRLPQPLDLDGVRDVSITELRHKASIDAFRAPAAPSASFGAVLDSLPDFLGARALRDLAACIARSHRGGHHVVAAMGGHVVKVGCGRILIDLMERGLVMALCVNGAVLSHD